MADTLVYKSSETATIETMDKLMSWLPANVPEQTLATSVVQARFLVIPKVALNNLVIFVGSTLIIKVRTFI